MLSFAGMALPEVALRKESVDRNLYCLYCTTLGIQSLSARRAWIEITMDGTVHNIRGVALRKESVDRNQEKSVAHETFDASLSARRAWIEIDWAKSLFRYLGSRSPQGERG